jgi:hypothetical protein
MTAVGLHLVTIMQLGSNSVITDTSLHPVSAQSPAKLAAAASPPRGLQVQRGSSSSSARGVEVPQVVRKLPAAAATDGSQAMYETVQGKLVVVFVSVRWLL